MRLAHDGIVVDLVTQLVTLCGGAPFELPRRQFLLLACLLNNRGRYVGHEELREQVFRGLPDPDGSTLRNHVGALRRQLGIAGNVIVGMRGVGYGIGVSDGVR